MNNATIVNPTQTTLSLSIVESGHSFKWKKVLEREDYPALLQL